MSPQASSIEVARAYSKGGDFKGQPQRRCPIRYYQVRLTATLLARKITRSPLSWGATRPRSRCRIWEDAVKSWTRDLATRVCKPLPLVPLIGLVAMVGAVVACVDPAAGQGYPSKEIKFIVPFPPGGVTDLNARILARHLTKLWGQPVTVSNMAGGGGTDGTMFVLNSPKDGYTMMMSATGQGTQNPAIDSKLPYKWDEPTLLARTSVSPLVFVVKGDSPWSSLREVVDDVKKDPAKDKYGPSGPGGVGSIALSLLFGSNGIDVQALGRVTLQGGAGLLEAVATGRTDFAAQYLAEMGPLLASKTLKPLAVSTPARVNQLPNTPTSQKAGS